MNAVHLRCDYLETPLGLGDRTPEFSWRCEGGIRQSAYWVVALRGKEIIWSTGKVASSSMTHIKYEGEPIESRARITWKVCLWDENGREGEWAESWFETGLLEAADWTAKWITGAYKPKKNERYPADLFRKYIPLKGAVSSARLYITACGMYEAYIGGTRVGDFVLAPGSTDYRKRLQYQAYDVTDLLTCGERGGVVPLEILLGDGWFRGSIGCFGKVAVFGRETKVLAQLEIAYADGSKETVGTDDSFAWTNDTPIRFNDFKDGEAVDASMHPAFSRKAKVTSFNVVPSAADNVPVTCHEEFAGKLITTPSGRQVIDFGQNLAGFVAFTIKGAPWQKITLTLGETLDENGEFTQKNMVQTKPVKEFGMLGEVMLMTGNASRLKGEMQPTPRQQINFRCSGNVDTYETRFALFGFRYALADVEAADGGFVLTDGTAASFRAIAVYSDMERTGSFSCSDERVNRLMSNITWSMRSNFVDVPMDCPTRERLGWTGDAQIFFNSGAYLYDTASFYRKWLRDLKDNQNPKSGKISAVAPFNGFPLLYDNTGASAGWADAAILVPYRFYRLYGDKRVLEESWPLCSGLASFMIKNAGPRKSKDYQDIPHRKYLYEKGFHLGEWLEPEEFMDKIAAGVKIKHTEVATAYMHLSMSCMAEMAAALGKTEDEKLYREYADGAKSAYRELFLSAVPDTDRQSKLVRPLAFGLVPEDMKGAVADRLIKALEYYEYRVGTGFLSTPFLLSALTSAGQTEAAYKVLLNEKMPGWLYEVEHGATTVWENWEGTLSLNHYSPGAVCEWLFSSCGGIRVKGENAFDIRPVPGGTLTSAKAEYASPYGTVSVSWQRDEDGILYTISVPSNTTADITLPEGSFAVSAGTYTFRNGIMPAAPSRVSSGSYASAPLLHAAHEKKGGLI